MCCVKMVLTQLKKSYYQKKANRFEIGSTKKEPSVLKLALWRKNVFLLQYRLQHRGARSG